MAPLDGGFSLQKVPEGEELPSSSSLDSLFNSLFPSSQQQEQAPSPAQDSSFPQQDWFKQTLGTERGQRLFERVSHFEARIAALQELKETLYAEIEEGPTMTER